MLPRDGYKKVAPGKACRLKTSLSGIKQASKQWNHKFTAKLKTNGFIQPMHDHCLFVRSTGSPFLALIVFVGDVLFTGSCEADIVQVKDFLHEQFTIKI